ncbi:MULTISPECIES: Dps family protein [unclassified Rothia (in: high G+C Gram-positive bacteria)]|uniref:Dps family protein n=1 Tax=unclassified Rothia (in: high G+C Gram-positive bacteria) TaxID=2689056 RepID=UPI0019570BA6|nr:MULTISPECIES: DNA starvation/stationary phase protection protein [unclassified Rothia (in: high G+C Gram-positive bacteria)]MBM7052017.1 DNA starvation/stationary phase protection protein [Rothia sp. ZJ1223]QRZ61923.1 DNA starvation/stationary phase protection protein [Rothia sp. ZJ932]
MSNKNAAFTVPGLVEETGHQIADALQLRLHAMNDLHLTLKHAHWNVVGPNFIAVHEMLDPQVDLVRGYADEIAERMATMGVSPNGLPGALVEQRTWNEYDVNRGDSLDHLRALNDVYTGIIEDNRAVIAKVGDLDPITEDLLIGQTAELEKFQWFIRSHIEDGNGNLS